MEAYLRSAPPLAEASAFFLRLKGTSAEDTSLAKLALDAAGLAPVTTPPETPFPGIVNEQEANDVEEQQTAAFYRQKMQEALAEVAAHQQEMAETQAAVQDLHAQLEQQGATAAQYQRMVTDATERAVTAQDQVLQEQQAAAAMRMAYQQLRGELLSVASREPPTTQALSDMASAQGGVPSVGPAAPSASPPTALSGPAGEAPAPPADPTSPSPDGDDSPKARMNVNSNEAPQETGRVSIKQGAPAGLPYAAAGAGLGGLVELALAARGNDALREKVTTLSSRGDKRSLGQALDLAQAKARLAFGELREQHPTASTLSGMAMGALLGTSVGPEAVENIKMTADALRRARRLG